MTEYSESEFIVPALKFMRDNLRGINTTQLIHHLEDIFKPSGHDAEIIKGRNDTYFSQKVRNLKSHNTLRKSGWTIYQNKARNGIWTITPKGLKYIEELELSKDDMQSEDIIASLQNQGFSPEIINKEAKQNYKGLIIEEGSVDKRTTIQRNRSNKLREIAVIDFKRKHKGELFCTICGFNFLKIYGQLGKDFIEVHHMEPMHLKDIKGESCPIEVALKKVTLVCPNCHRMIHQVKQELLSIVDIKRELGNPCFAS